MQIFVKIPLKNYNIEVESSDTIDDVVENCRQRGYL